MGGGVIDEMKETLYSGAAFRHTRRRDITVIVPVRLQSAKWKRCFQNQKGALTVGLLI